MPNGIFINYRHRDTQGEASRLADDLREALDDVQVFRDVETIEAGADFGQQLEKALSECSVLLAMIGPTWLEQRDAQGNLRIDDPNDWTRTEIATGLARGVRVIPIKCRDASMPKAEQLPAEIQALARRQAFELDNNRWRYDVERLIDRLVATGDFRRAAKSAPFVRSAIVLAFAALLMVGLAVIWTSGVFDKDAAAAKKATTEQSSPEPLPPPATSNLSAETSDAREPGTSEPTRRPRPETSITARGSVTTMPERCLRILQRMQLGEAPNEDDKRFLQRECK